GRAAAAAAAADRPGRGRARRGVPAILGHRAGGPPAARRMRVVEGSTIQRAEPGGPRGVAAVPTPTVMRDGSILATYSVGSGKDTDDIGLELRRSTDGGRTWSDPERPFSNVLDGINGSVKVGYVTRLEGGAAILVGLWIDREAYPGAPLFDPETEGC